MLKITNTLSGSKEPLIPLVPNQVRMYVCGVTVYDESHLGHARSALVFDVIRRYLKFSGYAVTYVRNFTDVDDKIIARASQEGVSCQDIVDRYMDAYQRDMARLGVVSADVEPRATHHMPDIIKMIQQLADKGHAYQVDGDVYFEVGSFPAYGRLSKRKADELLAGARVEVDERKRHPMDFALWKSSKPGEPAWESPWGPGRPGWHIECSAMSTRHLGATFDIHGGGMDLIFPHHENEIAQSCAATGGDFARHWVHNGFVQINQEKMSKSLGNFFTIREIFEKWSPQWRFKEPIKKEAITGEVLRYLLLSTHYRSPLDFSDSAMWEAKRTVNRFYDLFKRLDETSVEQGASDGLLQQAVDEFEVASVQAMDDDLNTPVAISHFHVLRGKINGLMERGLSRFAREMAREQFRRFGKVLEFFQLRWQDWDFAEGPHVVQPPTGWLQTDTFPPRPSTGHRQDRSQYSVSGTAPITLSDIEVEQKLSERMEARRKRDFKRADEIRAELASFGITIEDRPDGTSRWKR